MELQVMAMKIVKVERKPKGLKTWGLKRAEEKVERGDNTSCEF